MNERRFALIIASYEYEDSKLRQLVAPAHDAEVLASVLGNPAIGGFDVQTLLNKPSHEVRLEIERFFTDRKRDDLLLFYFSGHGIKDEDGLLYFSATDTKRKLLRATAIEANFVNNVMQSSRSRMQVLLLDCCYSGAFARGMLAKADKRIGAKEHFEGIGRVVLTASDSMQYAFEGDQVEGKGVHSVFTNSLVHGLETGAADRDGDDHIDLDELYDYVHDRVIDETPNQRPSKWNFGVQGKIIIARNPNPVVKPVELPPKLMQAINDDSREIWERVGDVRELGRLLQGNDKGLVLSAHKVLKRLQDDDSRRVNTEAKRILKEYENVQTVREPNKRNRLIWLLPSTIVPFIVIVVLATFYIISHSGKQIPEEKQKVYKPAETKTEEIRKKEIQKLEQNDRPENKTTKFRFTTKQKYSEADVESMLKDKGFFDSRRNKSASGFSNNYELQNDGKVVYDHASDRMWLRSGSDERMNYKIAKAYVTRLNSNQFAGHSDWRLPTLEETMSLMEPSKKNGDLYIDPVFDREQRWIWTSDLYITSRAWAVYFDHGGCFKLDVSKNHYVRAVR